MPFIQRSGILRPKLAALWVLVIALSAPVVYGQKGGSSGGGSGGAGGGSRGSSGGGTIPLGPPPIQPGMSPTMDPGVIVPTPVPVNKPEPIVDESCFPWEVPDARGATVSAMRLAVPGSARSQYDKACGALKKNRLTEAEQHARDAIEKYANYSAAWVMLGQALQGEEKFDDAHDACARPIGFEPTYLPPYLCLAALLDTERNWTELLAWTDRFLGLNLTGDMYAYYYRAVAQFHMQNLPEAQKSVSKAIAIDSEHRQPAMIFLLAQIYGQQGDMPDAAAQIQQYVKYSPNRQDRDAARAYLAELQSKQEAK